METVAPAARAVHARGTTAYNRPARLGARAAAATTDLAALLGLFGVELSLFGVEPYPGLALLAWLASQSAALWALQRFALNETLGERIWRISRGRSGAFYQREKLAGERLAISALIAGGICLAALLALRRAVFLSPLFIAAEPLHLEGAMPEVGTGSDWAVSPYFYALGAWPTRFHGHDITYTLPYEKGPPTLFMGHLIARWDSPGVHLTFEGPKTPAGAPARDDIRDCLLSPWSGAHGLSPLQCLAMRETALMRHFREIRRIDPSGWKLRWFRVDNPAVPEAQQTQGVYLEAANDLRAEERYILITPHGTHQALILDYPPTETGEDASHMLETAVESLRVADDLRPGTDWVDRELESVKLAGAERSPEELTRIEGELLSRLTVDPKLFDTYLYLGEVGMLLARTPGQDGSARGVVQSAYRYAQDVAPREPRLAKLQGFAIEAQR